MKQKRVIIVCLLLGLFLCGCEEISTIRQQPSYSIGVVLKANNSPYWMDMQAGMEHAASVYGADLTLLYPSGEQESDEQNKLINDLLESDIDLLMVSPCDCYDTMWMVEKAEEQDIVMLTVDDRSVYVDIPYIGSDNEEIGRNAADYFAKKLPEGGSLFVLLGPEKQMSSQDRLYGLRSNLTSDLRIQEVVYTEMTEISAYRAIMNLEEPIDGVFCQNVVLAQGAVAALEEKHWDAQMVTVDTTEDASQVMKRGRIDAVLQQDGYKIGYQAVRIAVETIQTGETPQDVLFTSELITKED